MKGGLMVCGTASGVGKTCLVTGLCRLLARRGVRVAPFKAQNMSLNSWVTASGHEIGRAQGVQALAAGIEPEGAMNPILLKPAGPRESQAVVMGRAEARLDVAAYHAELPRLWGVVLDALADLRSRFDVVLVEGAGSCTEINLLANDIANLPLARRAGLPAVVVGDIERGGVFAALHGTVALLPPDLRRLVRGFVINRFRGDMAHLGDASADLERHCGVPTLGVLPWVDEVTLDAEDSLDLDHLQHDAGRPATGDRLDVAAVRFPHLANATDLDALAIEPEVDLRLVATPAALGRPDLVVLPGTKATLADLDWLRDQHLDRAILASGATVLGICGGAQMLGRRILDGVESARGQVEALGWLDVTTTFAPDKVTRRQRGEAMGQLVTGYQIHHGRLTRGLGADPWVHLDGHVGHGPEEEGAASRGDERFFATTLHSLFEQDGFRATFLAAVAQRAGRHIMPGGVSFLAARQRRFDRLADVLEGHLDTDALQALIREGAPS